MSRSGPFLGIFLMMAAMTLFPVKDGFAKLLGDTYFPVGLAWLQYVFMWLALAPVVAKMHGAAALIPRPLPMQALRGCLILGAVCLFYWALNFIPLADTTAMTFVGPLVTTAVSPVFLGEKVGIRRWMAVLAGFAGVLIILRPDFGGERVGYVIGLGAGICVGLFYAANRKLADADPPLGSALHSALFGALLPIPLLPWIWVPLQLEDAGFLGGFVVLGLAGQMMLVNAFRYGQASLVSPFLYWGIVSSTVFGWFVFGDFPDLFTWIGAAILILAGIYIMAREARAAEAAAAEA